MNKNLFSNPSFAKIAMKNSSFASLIGSSQLDSISKLQNTAFKMNESIFVKTAIARVAKEHASLSSMLVSSHISKIQSLSFAKIAMKNSSFASLIGSSQLDSISKLQNTAFKMNESILAKTAIDRVAKEKISLLQGLSSLGLNASLSHISLFEKNSSFQKSFDSLYAIRTPKITTSNFGFSVVLKDFTRTNRLYTEMLNDISQEAIAVLNPEYVLPQNEVVIALKTLSEENYDFVLENFKKLSLHLKIAIIWILHNLLLPFSISVVAAYTYDYLQNNQNKTSIQKTRDIKKIPKKLNLQIDTTYYRFTTADILNVRTKPSITKSEVIGKLKRYSIVEILDKRKNWIKVSYRNGNISIKGWVFTRYTHKFDN